MDWNHCMTVSKASRVNSTIIRGLVLCQGMSQPPAVQNAQSVTQAVSTLVVSSVWQMTTVAGVMKAPTACQEHPVALTTTNASLETGVMALILVDRNFDCGMYISFIVRMIIKYFPYTFCIA